jgi:hypothetical protein
MIDFTKRFNKVYQKLPTKVKPPETTAMITFANAFDVKLVKRCKTTKLASHARGCH